LTAIGIPAVGAVSYHDAWSEAVNLVHQAAIGSTSVRAKDETRLTSVARGNELVDVSAGPAPARAADAARVAQAFGPPPEFGGPPAPARAADAARVAQAFGPPPEFGGPPAPRGAFGPIGPHVGMGPTPTRVACEDRIDFEI